jgi:hypothetical protein
MARPTYSHPSQVDDHTLVRTVLKAPPSPLVGFTRADVAVVSFAGCSVECEFTRGCDDPYIREGGTCLSLNPEGTDSMLAARFEHP